VDLPPAWIGNVRGKSLLKVFWRDDGSDAHDVQVDAEAISEALGEILATQLGNGVCVCGLGLDRLGDGEAGKITIALGISLGQTSADVPPMGEMVLTLRRRHKSSSR
jgi:hypothetical protein